MMINVDGVILAAGKSSRMGRANKVLANLGGRSLLEIAVEKLGPQVDTLVINGDPALCGEQALADRAEGFQGPLMGLYTALLSEQLSRADYLMMVPCDGPFLPDNLVAELYQQIVQADADIACVRYQGFVQPTFSLWHKRVLPDIEQALSVEKNGGFKPLLQRLNAVYLDWPEQDPSPFFNINTPQDLALAETLLCP
ncbi:molybdenum cofactor guanylyltransferase [Porticoccaceae bacterium]|jgi:molybdopterin-guanine dinucleotide biosynthesis protein A|nr:molybdenum cofactor guanylyltransferase [Porticoccaceae bacterium]MDB2549748.1 molybdenum cofactor guanylyltransferase [Porticoccaceae bacterium]